MPKIKRSIKIINDLFTEAQEKESLQYVFTLLRVEETGGITDPLIIAKKKIDSDLYTEVDEDSVKEILEIIANLLNCCLGYPYSYSPFFNLYKGNYPETIKPTSVEMLKDIIERLSSTGKDDFAKLLDSSNLKYNTPKKRSGKKTKEFAREFLKIYFGKRLEFDQKWKIYKMPDFQVLELMTNSDHGLYGFKLHFSNGTIANFERHEDFTISSGIIFLGTQITFMAGDWSEMQKKWIIDGKKLYEIGLPGRYNKRGEWKPLVYEGDFDLLNKELLDFLKEEKDKADFYDLYGCFQYIMATCHHVVEFIVKTNIKFPFEDNNFSVGKNKFTLSLIKFDDSISNSFSNMHVYDCSVVLESITIDNIRFVINSINTIFSRISFQTDSWHKVIYKYTGSSHPANSVSLHKKTDSLINYFSCFADNDSSRIDLAIEWYVSGNNSDNLFHKFLSYCIALESIAIPFAEGNLEVGKDFGIEYKETTEEEKIKLIKEIEQRKSEPVKFEEEPLKFIELANLALYPSLSVKMKKAIEKAFGKESKEIKMFSEKTKHKGDRRKYNLYNMRSRLAHGDFSLNDNDDLELVQQKMPVISYLAKRFIMKLLKKKANGKNIAIKMEGGRCISLMGADPRTFGIASNLNAFPNKDWKIKVDWIF